MTTRRRRLPTPAYVLLGAVGALLVFGLIMVYSASSVADYVQLGDSAYHMRRQAIYAMAGIVGLGVASMWDFRQRRGRRLVLTPSRVAWAVRWPASPKPCLAMCRRRWKPSCRMSPKTGRTTSSTRLASRTRREAKKWIMVLHDVAGRATGGVL